MKSSILGGFIAYLSIGGYIVYKLYTEGDSPVLPWRLTTASQLLCWWFLPLLIGLVAAVSVLFERITLSKKSKVMLWLIGVIMAIGMLWVWTRFLRATGAGEL